MPLVEPQERKSRWYQSYNNNSKIYVEVEMFDPYLWEMDWQSIKTNDSFTVQASASAVFFSTGTPASWKALGFFDQRFVSRALRPHTRKLEPILFIYFKMELEPTLSAKD